MPNSGVAITPGVGANIAVNATNDLDYQVIKLDAGADGASYPLVGDGTHGLPVQVTQVQGVVVVNNPTAANLKVDASGATVPVSAASALPVSALVTAPVFVALSTGSAQITNLPVAIAAGGVGQGAPTVSLADAWPMEITDGANGVAAIAAVSDVNALCVKVLATPGAGALADGATFTEGTTTFDAIGGEYNTGAGAATSGKAAACQITQYRGLHVNLRAAAGTEIGTSGAPVRTDPTGTTTQPVSGTVAATLTNTTNAGAPATQPNYNTSGTTGATAFGILLPGSGGPVAGGTQTNPVVVTQGLGGAVVSATNPLPAQLSQAGAAATAANPVPVQPSIGGAAVTSVSAGAGNPVPTLNQPTPSGWWRAAVGVSASETAQAVHTPASGKTGYIEGFIVAISTAGILQVYDGTNSASTLLLDGELPVGVYVVTPSRPLPQAAVNNVLRYTTPDTAVGTITIWGYDA